MIMRNILFMIGIKAKVLKKIYMYILAGSEGCPIVCKGRFFINNTLYDEENCVEYNISFRLNNTISTYLRDVPCKIPKCIFEAIHFECKFSTNTTNTTHLDPTKTLSTEVPRTETGTCIGNRTINQHNFALSHIYARLRCCIKMYASDFLYPLSYFQAYLPLLSST